jgi:hypothetical protein
MAKLAVVAMVRKGGTYVLDQWKINAQVKGSICRLIAAFIVLADNDLS